MPTANSANHILERIAIIETDPFVRKSSALQARLNNIKTFFQKQLIDEKTAAKELAELKSSIGASNVQKQSSYERRGIISPEKDLKGIDSTPIWLDLAIQSIQHEISRRVFD